jgi:4-amino-4-deoxy-L-arabinose transferase-like glycosyltransferase
MYCFWAAAQISGPGVLTRWLAVESLLLLGLLLVAILRAQQSPTTASAPTAEPPAAGKPRSRLGYLLIVLAVAAALRFPSLGYGEFDKDELDVAQWARSTLLGQTNVVYGHRKGPTEIWFTAIAAGTSGQFDEATARLPFVLASLGAIAGTVLLGEEFFGRRRGLLAGLLLSGEGIFLGFSRMAQYQGVVLLMVVLTAWCAYRFWRAQEKRAEAYYLALGVLFWSAGVFAHWDGLAIGAVLAYAVWQKWLAPARNEQFSDVRAHIARHGRELLALLVVTIAFFAIPLDFYLQLFFNPQAAQLKEYAGERIGFSLFNGAPTFMLHFTFYDASPFAVALLCLAAVVLGRHVPRLGWLIIGLMALSFFWPSFLQIGPVNLSLFVFGSALALLLRSRTPTVPEKLLFIWLLVYFMVYGFIIKAAGLHFYTMMPALMLLVAEPLLNEAFWGRRGISPVLARAISIGACVLLLLAAYAYDAIAYLREQPEYALNYPRTAVPIFPTLYNDRPRDFFFGFPYRYGWSAIGELYRQGILRGKFESNETYLVTDWYARDIQAAQDDEARYFFRVDDAPRGADLPPDLDQRFHPWGEVQVHGETRIRIYENNSYAPVALQIFAAESFPAADATLLARSFTYRQARGDDRAFRDLGHFLDNNLTASDALVLDSPLQDGIVPYYYRGAAQIVKWSADPGTGEGVAGASRVFASLWGGGEAERFLAQHDYPIDSRWFGSVRLATYAPPVAGSRDVNAGAAFGESVHLKSYSLAPATLHPGEVLRLGLKWETAQALSTRYKVFVHLLSAQGTVIAQRDSEPMADLAPTTTWNAGDTIIDLHGLMLPPNVQPQALRVAVGLYDPGDNERLPVRDANGVSLSDAQLVINGVTAMP